MAKHKAADKAGKALTLEVIVPYVSALHDVLYMYADKAGKAQTLEVPSFIHL